MQASSAKSATILVRARREQPGVSTYDRVIPKRPALRTDGRADRADVFDALPALRGAMNFAALSRRYRAQARYDNEDEKPEAIARV